MSDTTVHISLHMIDTGLPPTFVQRVLDLARESPGIDDLAHLWSEAPDADERAALEAELQSAIDDRGPPGPPLRVLSADHADTLLAQRRALTAHLRALVDRHGGITAVARRAEMPQPSLSRLLNSMSEPRTATLARLAAAMGLPVSSLTSGAPH